MITKIFYSLVFFPKLQYTTEIDGRKITFLREASFGSIEVVFGDFFVVFTHVDFDQENTFFTSKNWKITGNNFDFTKKIFDIISQNEISDFWFFKDQNFLSQIPFWTVLTITSKCNLFCNYCFNDYDYPLAGRNKRKWLGLEEYKKIVDMLYLAGTRDIILTGWEPFASGFIFELMEYIREKWIFIRINTNGTLLSDEILEKLSQNFSLNLMVSMHEFNNKDYYEINKLWAKNFEGIETLKSFEDKFEKKVIQLEKIKNFPNITLDFLTILTPKNIMHLEKIYEFVLKKFHLENWHFFRLYSTWTTIWISRPMINLALHKLYKLNQKYQTHFKIVDSVPYCVTKNIEVARTTIDGELSPHHNVKTIITTDGLIQIMSAFDGNLGSIFENDISKVWKSDFVQKMLHQGFLPKECQNCKYKDECRWGSRMDANIYNGSYDAFDPLWDLNNKIIA